MVVVERKASSKACGSKRADPIVESQLAAIEVGVLGSCHSHLGVIP